MYTSALLVLIGRYKEELLAKTSFTEQQLLKTWCSVFDYRPADMQLFDQELSTVYRQQGTGGLAEKVSLELVEVLFPQAAELSLAEIAIVENRLIDDAAAIVGNLDQAD